MKKIQWLLFTGSTRGIGQHLKNKFEAKGVEVLCLTRQNGFNLAETLSDEKIKNLKNLVQPYFENKEHQFLGFIHCAGVVDSAAKNLHEIFQVNFFSFVEIYNVLNDLLPLANKHLFSNNLNPEKLSNEALSHEALSREANFVPRFMHLSSGAANSSYVGWEGYCSSKAAMLSYTKCLAEKYTPSQQLHLSIAPGTVYTDMMKQVLSQEENKFPQIHKFKELESKGKLENPEVVASKLFEVFFNSELCAKIHGLYADVRKPPLLT